jgi:DNA-binding NtrC family response regulator
VKGLVAGRWPGNIRELENVICRAGFGIGDPEFGIRMWKAVLGPTPGSDRQIQSPNPDPLTRIRVSRMSYREPV